MEKKGVTILNNSTFNKIENNILKDVTNLTKSIINTFKFQMIYHSKVPRQTEMKTLKLVKDYRKKNNGSYKKHVKELFS